MNTHLVDEKYFVDDQGNISINVNIWGYVKNPGSHFFYEGIDLITVLSMVGGPQKGADLKNIKLIRHQESENKKQIYNINLEPYYKSGDISNFPAIKPNDTIIIDETLLHSLFTKNSFITILQILNLYLQITR